MEETNEPVAGIAKLSCGHCVSVFVMKPLALSRQGALSTAGMREGERSKKRWLVILEAARKGRFPQTYRVFIKL